MGETQKVVAVLISLIANIVSCIQLNIAMLNSHADYMKKRMIFVRLLSLPLTKAAIVKRLRKKRQRKKRFWIRPGRTSAWWNGFIGEIVVPEEWRENFRMSQLDFVVRPDKVVRFALLGF